MPPIFHNQLVRRILLFSWMFCITLTTTSKGQSIDTPAIIPRPVSMHLRPGNFILNAQTTYWLSDDSLRPDWEIFQQDIQQATGFRLSAATRLSNRNMIALRILPQPDNQLGPEGYRLSVSPQQVELSANTRAGIFYGLQTLLQLLPPQIESHEPVKGVAWSIPCVQIVDFPRFHWRGLMLDVSRHFFTKQEVEAYIDEMARFKFNVFHWHLSDDNGWRIEIKGLPRLTSVGAWRVSRTGDFGTFDPPQTGEPADDGGYYTQDDIREVVAYAAQRHITILPEIDVPAHSLALIAAYPNLSCTGLPYAVNPGSPFYRILDNVLCTGKDSTYIILDTIFAQIARLFPGPYIHVGGDEAYKGFWAQDPRDQAVMQQNGLHSLEELQGYFERRVEQIVIKHGKKMIGWDEILEGGLAPEAAVMSWRGIQGGIAAARQQHNVVMSPWGHCYLDLYQGDPLVEPKTYGMLRLDSVYFYEPVPPGVDSSYILGIQGNLWTEHVPNLRHAEYMTWPRALAIAEVGWTPAAEKNWPDFIRRVEAEFPRFDAQQVKYATSMYQPIIQPVRDSVTAELEVKLHTQMGGLKIYYSFDGTNPDSFYPAYQGKPLSFPKGATELRVVSYRGQQQMSPVITITRDELVQRLGY
ncbi:hexosaminidase [Thermoflavifilum aggregans]|uniref:beta-N-acetylhexosaminidase n=1 Tax=Thermoflavifilum aggregans TaxID=454188 RepID=A0A2M9CVL8_9BACT|nr:family 20 glycosylhydrolase [Thermoflavifilum aggregans]PJJ75972.1 hexosaminidase [Thermoflavifilum aggregans]